MKRTLIIISVLFIIVVVMVFRPVPIVTEDQVITEQGIVEEIYEVSVDDVVFILENNKRKFYINRGLELGLKLDDLK
uniref:hypothetical protein n=1 Tax=Flavobacterium sp. TaxID=239 RepID=UPI00404A3F20